MMSIKMLTDSGNGKSVAGAPGFMTPADKARLEEQFIDGYDDEVFTTGGATFETIGE